MLAVYIQLKCRLVSLLLTPILFILVYISSDVLCFSKENTLRTLPKSYGIGDIDGSEKRGSLAENSGIREFKDTKGFG